MSFWKLRLSEEVRLNLVSVSSLGFLKAENIGLIKMKMSSLHPRR